MGSFSVRTASLVTVYIGAPTCLRTASRVSCLPVYPTCVSLLLPAWEAVTFDIHLYCTRLSTSVTTV
jgi:hypothetical protein